MDSVGDARDLADAGASPAGRVASNAAMPADAPAPVEVPLCVDLDGTLVRCDCMVEAGLAVLRRQPWLAFAMPVWWARGRAPLKRELAQRARIDPATLPYDPVVLDHLRGEHARGRRLVLATGSDRLIADGVAAHLGLFSEVFASDGQRSLTGVAKQRALVERFGEKGFDYVANDVVDLAVWRSARAAVVVDATPALVRRVTASTRVDLAIARRGGRARAAVMALRPHQWLKNLLIFLPLITAGALAEPGGAAACARLFVAWCAAASAIYLANDLLDLQADRAHRTKRLRAFASGALSPLWALALIPPLGAVAATLAWSAGPACLAVLVGYVVVATAYSWLLKTVALADVFVLAGLYVLRMEGGGLASGRTVSTWLLGFASFLFLSLAFMKRVGELARGSASPRRGYRDEDRPLLALFGVAAGFTAAVVLALYLHSDVARTVYRSPEALWCLVPLLLFWLCRMWLQASRGEMHDDPLVHACRDGGSWLVLAAGVAVYLVAYGLS